MDREVLVIGGGIAGIQASLDLADRGFQVYLVEKTPSIGGVMAQLDKTFPTMDCSICILAPKMMECYRHPNIRLLTYSELVKVSGSVGDFTVNILKKSRFVDEKTCTGCDECTSKCPVVLPNEFEMGLGTRKAIYRPFPQAVPNVFTIDKRGIPPCRAACPAGVNVQGYVALVKEGKFEEALNLIRKEIPFPAVCGRVCFNPCEAECERGKVDEPIAIKDIKRFLADFEIEKGKVKVEPLPRTREQRVAVIGSGPFGLTAAYELVKLGYPVTVFESMPDLGGMLRYGIPSYRLPKDVLDIEIQRIKDLGVEMKTGSAFGEDLTLDELLRMGYEAILVAIGCQKSRKLYVEGEDLEGVMQALDFLKDVNMGKETSVKGRVAVIGGGNVAIDAARSALRVGADEVSILYRRSREEMPAYPEDLKKAEGEGIKLHYLVNPKRLIGSEGRVAALKCVRMELGEPDESGRKRPVPIDCSEFTIDVDTVILAVGQTLDTSCVPDRIEVTKTEAVMADDLTLETSRPGVFAGGDAVRGPATVIEAIADGKRVAESIYRYLRGEDLRSGREAEIQKVKDVSREDVEILSRQTMPVLPSTQRGGNFKEIDLGFTEEMARREAERCLSCGGCSECLECEKVCEAKAINHQQRDELLELKVGSIVLATGFTQFEPEEMGEYGYKRFKNVLTSLEFERLVCASGPTRGILERPSDKKIAHRVAFVQCVGSRSHKIGYPYCSSACCMYATKEAILIKDHEPESEVTIFYTDLKVFGKGFQRFVERAKENWGVRYVRGRPGEIREDPLTKDLIVWYEDTERNRVEKMEADLVVLCPAMIPRPDIEELSSVLGTSLDEYGFIRVPNLMMAPLETTVPGIYVCGACHGPRDIPESVAEASGAAAKAAENVRQVTVGQEV